MGTETLAAALELEHREIDVLAESAASRLQELIASRQLPEGWACAKAAAAPR